MAGAIIGTVPLNVSLSNNDGSIIDITITNTGAPITNPGFIVTAVYVDEDNEQQYVYSQPVTSLGTNEDVTLSLAVDGVTTFVEANLRVGIGFIHSTATP